MSEEDDWPEMLDEPDPCDCEDYDVDLLEGRTWCPCCGRRWALSSVEIERELAFQAEYAETMAEEIEATDKP